MALKRYAQMHHDAPNREYYVFHTGRELLDISERTWLRDSRGWKMNAIDHRIRSVDE